MRNNNEIYMYKLVRSNNEFINYYCLFLRNL